MDRPWRSFQGWDWDARARNQLDDWILLRFSSGFRVWDVWHLSVSCLGFGRIGGERSLWVGTWLLVDRLGIEVRGVWTVDCEFCTAGYWCDMM